MADATASGLPYPELPDDNNPPADFRALAEAIDAIYGSSVANTAALPVLPAFKGQRIYVEDIDAIAWYDDKTSAWQGFWKPYTPTIGGTANPTLAFEHLIEGENVRVRVKLTLTAAITTLLSASLPVAVHASYTSAVSVFDGALMYRDTSAGGSARSVGWPVYGGSDTINFSYNETVGVNNSVTAGTGRPLAAAWASGDTIDGEFTYRRA